MTDQPDRPTGPDSVSDAMREARARFEEIRLSMRERQIGSDEARAILWHLGRLCFEKSRKPNPLD